MTEYLLMLKTFTRELGAATVVILVSFLVSILAIKFLMGYIKKHDFRAFGWYRIVLGVVVMLYFTIFK